MKKKMISIPVSDFKGEDGLWEKGRCLTFDDRYERYVSRSCTLWANLLRRTKAGGSYSEKYPTYQEASNDFVGYQDFTEWCQDQHGYMNREINGRFWALDKDIIAVHNKSYSPETCCFLPQELNGLIRYDYFKKESGLMKGVVFESKSGRYVSLCSFEGRKKYCGCFLTEIEAHLAWRDCKAKDLIKAKERVSYLPDKVLAGIDNHIVFLNNFHVE